ncbi:MAG: redoxin domain-containing protein [Planctomycetes bacterium]|nr:redoxin domain-containing protein [Planctomycetota bacterium]
MLAGSYAALVKLPREQPKTLGFPLRSDPDHAAAEAYGAWGEQKNYGKTYMGIIRSPFLVDEQGKVARSPSTSSPAIPYPRLGQRLRQACEKSRT